MTVDITPTIETMDLDLIRQAEEHHALLRYIAAAEKLKGVSDESLLIPLHHRIMEIANHAAAIKKDLLLDYPEQEGWKKQTEKHRRRDVMIHYKMDQEANEFHIRIDSPIESSLLNPLLSVFNESELYSKWMPRYRRPFKLGMSESNKLAELGRGHQLIQVKFDLPPMLNNLESFAHVCAVDSIEEDKSIVICIKSMDTGQHTFAATTATPPLDVPPPAKGYSRMDLHAGILVRPCPAHHPALRRSQHPYPTDQALLLVSVVKTERMGGAQHHLSSSSKLVAFMVRTVLATQWMALLQVAQDIRDGRRNEHLEAIRQKQDLYSWTSKRVQAMYEEEDEDDGDDGDDNDDDEADDEADEKEETTDTE